MLQNVSRNNFLIFRHQYEGYLLFNRTQICTEIIWPLSFDLLTLNGYQYRCFQMLMLKKLLNVCRNNLLIYRHLCLSKNVYLWKLLWHFICVPVQIKHELVKNNRNFLQYFKTEEHVCIPILMSPKSR